jgi:hypothetical protein
VANRHDQANTFIVSFGLQVRKAPV